MLEYLKKFADSILDDEAELDGWPSAKPTFEVDDAECHRKRCSLRPGLFDVRSSGLLQVMKSRRRENSPATGRSQPAATGTFYRNEAAAGADPAEAHV